MRIMNLSPAREPGPVVARFDCHVTDDLRLNQLILRRNASGALRCFPPNLRGVNVAQMSPALAAEITSAAIAALETETGGQAPHDLTS